MLLSAAQAPPSVSWRPQVSAVMLPKSERREDLERVPHEVLLPLVEEDPRRAKAIAEGALLRLWCGKQCFRRYRREFGLDEKELVRH